MEGITDNITLLLGMLVAIITLNGVAFSMYGKDIAKYLKQIAKSLQRIAETLPRQDDP